MCSTGSENGNKGPLFLVGPPRSGTKLLQSILNASSEVFIGPESHIFPKLLLQFGDASFNQVQKELSERIEKSNYWERLKRNGWEIKLDDLIQNSSSIPELISDLLRELAVQKQHEKEVLIGDKTPNYLRWTGLLRSYFPNALFVNIVRDPRDQALSVRKTWKKDPLLAAERWNRDLLIYKEARKEAPSQYFDLHYESLLEDPKGSIDALCRFLGISFQEEMLLTKSSERFGSGKGVQGVVGSNMGKYHEQMRRSRIRRIEEITFPLIQEWGYHVHYADRHRPVGPLYKKVARSCDLWNNLRFNLKQRGVYRGLKYAMSIRRDKERSRSG